MLGTIVMTWVVGTLINSTISLIKKKKYSELYCGIFGFCGDPKKMDVGMTRAAVAKFKILGLYNEERGKHSCGVYMNGEVLKGVDKDKLFEDFIKNNELPDPMQTGNFVLIGHTRQATGSDHTYENAHPHVIDEDFVLVHNGIIKNIWLLCNRHKVDHSDIHVDSLGLAHLINKEGFSVLNEYEGFAALIMSRGSEPNSMYIYRGVSKRTITGIEDEERPLFYMKADEGIYVSSKENGLLAISDGETDKISQVEGNVVHKITNGYMTKSKYQVNRESVNIGVSTNTHGGSAQQNYPKTRTNGVPITGTIDINALLNSFTRKMIPTIWFESFPKMVDKEEFQGEIVFFNEGRYWIAENTEAGQSIALAHGQVLINKKGKVLDTVANLGSIRECYMYHFFEGILMKNQKTYERCVMDSSVKDVFSNFCQAISRYAEFPVCNSRSDTNQRCRNIPDYFVYRWYKDGEIVKNMSFTPKWSNRNYVIKDGMLISISTQHGHQPEECVREDDLKRAREAHLFKVDQATLPFDRSTPVSVVNECIIRNMEQKYLGKIVVNEKKQGWDVNNYYRTWDCIEDIYYSLSDVELNAVRYYIVDVMMNEMTVVPRNIYDSRVTTQMNIFFQVCVDKYISIRDSWDEVGYKDIMDYVEIAMINRGGNVFDEDVEDFSISSNCCYVPEKLPIEDKITEMIEKKYQKDADSKLDEEPPFIDTIVNTEQANVPVERGELPEDQLSDDEKIERYGVEDAIDNLAGCRGQADELSTKVDSDYAQEIAALIYKTVDPALNRIVELSEQFAQKAVAEYAKKIIRAKASI